MIIVNKTYKAELEKADQCLEEHTEFLNEQYAKGVFLASGRKEPRTGGIIFCRGISIADLEKVIEQDPFKKHALADYEFIQFVPSKTCEELKSLLEPS